MNKWRQSEWKQDIVRTVLFFLLAGSSRGRTIGLNLKRPLYLGGVDPNVRVAPGAGVDAGFHGCIGEVRDWITMWTC